MANHYGSCKACRGQIIPGGKYYGRYCSSKCKDSARDPAKLSAKAERAKERQRLSRKHLYCPVCSGPLKGRSKLCSDTCKATWRLQWQRERQGFKGIAKPQPVNPCKHCGKGFKARIQGGRRFEYCSQDCYNGHRHEVKLPPYEPMTAEQLATSRLILSERYALKRIARYIERPSRYIIGCSCCIKSMVVRRNKGLHKKVCDDCIKASLAKANRVAKARRRARIRGREHEAIDPIKVFERDGWQCYICKRDTPKHLRGTHEPLAPELEHIHPISKGGTHTWANVACACRQCNQAKSDSLETIYTYKTMG